MESVKAFRDAFPTLHQSTKEVVKDVRPQTGYYASQNTNLLDNRDFPIMQSKQAKPKVYKVPKEPTNWTIVEKQETQKLEAYKKEKDEPQ